MRNIMFNSLLRTAATSTLLNGLMAYWKLDETSGTTVYDSTSNGINGTSIDVTSITGKISNAYSFNGSSSNVGFGAVCRPTGGLSVSYWINVTASQSTKPSIHNATYSTNWAGWLIYFTSGGFIRFLLGDNLTAPYQLTTTTNLRNTGWRHIVCTWDDTTDNVYIYVDGSIGASGSYSRNLVYHNNCNLHFASNETGTAGFANINLDEVGIWDRALSQVEVGELYNSGNGKSYPFN